MINRNVAKLKLPASMNRVHSSFNIELLTKFVPSPQKFGPRPIPKAAPIVIDDTTGEMLHIVERLLKQKQFNRKRYWLVQWHGLPRAKTPGKRKPCSRSYPTGPT
ncbi:TPA: hypothetical protein N0F65_008283 [Lagenidium giganteum]|uniref:Chromo domain-containing protein n=1 Tax=Lagenidium giganteum TaxID=4803 RepID=A0AAV2YUG1_9STRA|nr:TPA: hypothetical protein N0F65_008283 [Lagenidium giganteum]